MTETGVMTDPRLIAAAGFLTTYLLPYLIDLATRPDTDPLVKKLTAKVYSWALAVGAVVLEASTVDVVDSSAAGWAKRAVLFLTVGFGSQGVTHVGHKMTKTNRLREIAKQAGKHLLAPAGASIEDYAQGDKIPRSVRKKAEEQQRREFEEFQANRPDEAAAARAPKTVEEMAGLSDRDLIEEALRQAPPMEPPEA